jgi:hypothetical protein
VAAQQAVLLERTDSGLHSLFAKCCLLLLEAAERVLDKAFYISPLAASIGSRCSQRAVRGMSLINLIISNPIYEDKWYQ